MFIPYNGKIADITHADILRHTLDLQAALGDTREIIAVTVVALRQSGTGVFYVYPNEGADFLVAENQFRSPCVIIADGTNRLQYSLSVANDDWDLYCMGYVVEE